MPKHIVKKIWIWIIGVSLILSLGLTIFVRQLNINSTCSPDVNSNVSDNISVSDTSTHTGVVPTIESFDSNNPYACAEARKGNILGAWFTYLIFILPLAGVLNIILGMIYLIHNKDKKNTEKINWWSILASLILIVLPFVIIIYTLKTQF